MPPAPPPAPGYIFLSCLSLVSLFVFVLVLFFVFVLFFSEIKKVRVDLKDQDSKIDKRRGGESGQERVWIVFYCTTKTGLVLFLVFVLFF